MADRYCATRSCRRASTMVNATKVSRSYCPIVNSFKSSLRMLFKYSHCFAFTSSLSFCCATSTTTLDAQSSHSFTFTYATCHSRSHNTCRSPKQLQLAGLVLQSKLILNLASSITTTSATSTFINPRHHSSTCLSTSTLPAALPSPCSEQQTRT